MFKIQNQSPVSKIGLSIYSDLSTNILELFQKNTVTREIPVIFGTSLQPLCILLWLAVDNNLYKVREVVCCVDGVYSSMPVNSEPVFFRFYFKVRWHGVSLPWIRPRWAGSSSARSDDWLQTYHRYKFFSELVLLPATTRKRRDYSWDK